MFVTFFDVGIFITLGSPSCRLRCDQKYRVPLGYARGHGPRQTVDDLVIQILLCTSTHVWIPKSMCLAAKEKKHTLCTTACNRAASTLKAVDRINMSNIIEIFADLLQNGTMSARFGQLVRHFFASSQWHISHPSPHEPTNCSPTHPMFRMRTPDTTIASTVPSAQGSLLRRKRRTPVLQPTSWSFPEKPVEGRTILFLEARNHLMETFMDFSDFLIC